MADKINVLLCGAGSAGANTALMIAKDIRLIEKIVIIDYDVIEDRNLFTQPWSKDDIGANKADVLDEMIYNIGNCESQFFCEKIASSKELRDIIKFEKIHVVIDAFDNMASRKFVVDACKAEGVDCIHIGFNPDGVWEVAWDDKYEWFEDDDSVKTDMCTMQGVFSFITKVCAYASISLSDYATLNGIKNSFVGSFYTVRKL